MTSNPESLREGSAIEDFKRPDRVVIGAESDHARAIVREIYRPLFLNETPLLFTGLETAEVIKYAANAFLATKITFINEIADLCERVGADVQKVARGIGLDHRIGPKFLNAGPGYGGSCFPKDTRALVSTARAAEITMRIVETVITVNEDRKSAMARRIVDALGGSVTGKVVAVLGLSFKPNTDDRREARRPQSFRPCKIPVQACACMIQRLWPRRRSCWIGSSGVTVHTALPRVQTHSLSSPSGMPTARTADAGQHAPRPQEHL